LDGKIAYSDWKLVSLENNIHYLDVKWYTLGPKNCILGLKLDKIGWKLVYLDGNQVFMDW
jgi:hypothetical protein